MTRVAAIDIGTNSVLLLVAEATPSGPRAVVERAEITRLGRGVDGAGRLADDACERTLDCLRAYAAEARSAGVSRLVAAGTSAMRDASNGPDFARRAADILGVAPAIVSGAEEARLTFVGAVAGLDVHGEIGVFDVGGGSTELIHATWDGRRAEALSAVSLDVGSVRLFERDIRSDPPSPSDLARATADVQAALATLARPASPGAVVGVAGTVTTLAAVALGVTPYDGAKVHGARVGVDLLQATHERLAALPLAARRAVPGLEPKRADVIVTGGVIVLETLAFLGARELVISDRGVRWGLALDALASLGQQPSS